MLQTKRDPKAQRKHQRKQGGRSFFNKFLETLLTRLDVRHQTLLLPGEGHWFSPSAHLRILNTVATFLKANLG